jgi:putative ATP-dependent endonuclease of OLD family
MLFARGILLVEGDAERFLVPAVAKEMDVSLDHLGITVCSVAGTNFKPYVKILTSLGIPFAVLTDWDPQDAADALGHNRAADLARTIQRARSGAVPVALRQRLEGANDYDIREIALEFGIFMNETTLEVDLFRDDDFRAMVVEGLREGGFGETRTAWIDSWEQDPDSVHVRRFLSLVDAIGKGRFAQRLASRMGGIAGPEYIRDAIAFVRDRV